MRGASEKQHILGLGSVRREERESMTLNRERAGDQLLLRMSMQMLPCSDICWRKA
jgi:hypothetical protein